MKFSRQGWYTLGGGILLIIIIVGVIYFQKNNTNSTSMNDSTEQSQNTDEAPKSEVTGTNISSDPRIQIIEVQTGTGKEAKNGMDVYVHYTGTFMDGTKFDSSRDRGEPIHFALGAGRVIKGWDMGILGMKVGGKRHFIISPELGYGPNDYGPIPGNSTLVFDVELVDVQ